MDYPVDQVALFYRKKIVALNLGVILHSKLKQFKQG